MDRAARSRLNEALIRLADGDRAAFAPVHEALAPIVRRYCARLVGETDADDATQLTLLKLFSECHRFSRDGDAVRWALTLATWECRTLRRKRTRRRESHEERDVEAGESPERALMERDSERAAMDALDMLSEIDRSTLLADTAPPGLASASFRKRRERALARLREVWRRVHGA